MASDPSAVGEPGPSIPIWDSHMHIENLPGHPWHSPPERLLKQMDPFHVERAVVMPYSDISQRNREMLESYVQDVADHADRFILYARLDPVDGDGAAELLEYAVTELGYAGLKLHPVTTEIAPTDDRTVTLVRKAAQLNVPVLFHCGDEELTLPADIGPLAARVPEATILLGHSGGYFHVADAVTWAERVPNLMLDISATPDLHNLRRALDRLGPSRLIYASDGPGCPPSLDIHKTNILLKDADHQTKIDVFSGNLKRILPARFSEDAP